MSEGGAGGAGVVLLPKVAKLVGKLWYKPKAPRDPGVRYWSGAARALRTGNLEDPRLPRGLGPETIEGYTRTVEQNLTRARALAPYRSEQTLRGLTGVITRAVPGLVEQFAQQRARAYLAPPWRPRLFPGEQPEFGPYGTTLIPLPPLPPPAQQPGRIWATQPPRSGTGQQPIPGAPRDWQDLLWLLAQGGLEWWLQRRQQRDYAQQARRFYRALQQQVSAAWGGLTGGGDFMPYPITSFSPGGGAGWGDLLLGALGGATRALLPAGQGDLGYDVPYFPDVLVPDVIQRGMATSGAVGGPFGMARNTARAQRFLLPNPATGALTWFGPLGEPILWSRDFATVRRVRRIGGKARRWCGSATRRRRGGR